MMPEVKLLKQSITNKFPECSLLSINYTRANWVKSSDKIKIKTDIPYHELIEYLRTITSHMCVYRKGSIGAAWGKFESRILDLETDAEFIEIDSVGGYDKFKLGEDVL